LKRWPGALSRKFGRSSEFIEEATGIVGEAPLIVIAAVPLEVIREHPEDNQILECAVYAGSDYIVSGDTDLLRLKQSFVRGVSGC